MKVAEARQQQRVAKTPPAPPSPHSQNSHPRFAVAVVGVQRKARDLVPVVGDEPERRIEALATEVPRRPLAVVVRDVVPVIPKGFLARLEDLALAARTHRLDADAAGKLGLRRLF